MKTKRLRIVFSVLLALALCVSAASPAVVPAGAEDVQLHFDSRGKFRILNFSDIQDDATLDARTKQFIRRSVTDAQPDLIVLTGDNVYGNDVSGEAKTKTAIAQFMDIFEALGVPVALVFGNHDDDGSALSKEAQMAFYRTYSVCVANDDNSALDGCGTYNLPIYSYADRTKVAFNVWMFDTGSTKNLGYYDYMRASQLNWYVDTSNELKAANGGVLVPSIAFQHIVVKEIYSALKQVSSGTSGAIKHDSKYYVLPDNAAPGGVLLEEPCPSKYGNEFSTAVAQGDIKAIVCGHDHKNQFDIPYQGIRLINTPTSGYGAYGDDAVRGARIIDVNESDGSFTTEMINCASYNLEAECTVQQVNKYVKDVALCYFQEKNNGSLEGAHAKAYSCIYNAVDAAHGNGVVLNTDLNAGSTKDKSSSNHVVVYMGYTLTSNPAEALRGLGVFYAGSSSADQYDGSTVNGCTWVLCNSGSHEVSGTDGAVNLNWGTNGDALYMYATYDTAAGDPLTEIRIVDTGASSAIQMSNYPGYSLVYPIMGSHTGESYADLNKSASGDYVYALYRRGGLATIRSEIDSANLRGAYIAACKRLAEPASLYSAESRGALQDEVDWVRSNILMILDNYNASAAVTQSTLDTHADALRSCILSLVPPSYLIFLNANGGVCGTASVSIYDNGTFGELPTPVRHGYMFIGWFPSPEGGTRISAGSVFTAGSFSMLYAHWARDGSPLPGDVDGDDNVTLADVTLVLRALAGGWNITINTSLADVDQDGALTLKDALLMRRYVVGGWNAILL